jgi:hypothetical protein
VFGFIGTRAFGVSGALVRGWLGVVMSGLGGLLGFGGRPLARWGGAVGAGLVMNFNMYIITVLYIFTVQN